MFRTAIVCLVLLTAGCAAPTAPDAPARTHPTADAPSTTADATTADATPSTTTTVVEDSDAIPVSGGSLPVEHGRAFARTVDLLGVEIPPPSVVIVRSPAEIREARGGDATRGSGSSPRSFLAVVGIGQDDGDEGKGSDGDGSDDDGSNDDGSDEGVSVAAYVPSPHTVVVNERMTVHGRERALERTLAHEFVHVVQFRRDAFGRVQRALDLRRGYARDRYLTYVSVIEGAAVFVADAYDRRYLAGNSATITSADRYRSSPSGVKYSIARYYFGSRYLHHRLDSPSNLSAVYDDPPRTTEQLLHNDTNATETPEPLVVSTDLGENRTAERANTNGELFTRIALGTELNDSRAADAAAGWGADSLVPVTPANQTGNRSYVWATRWDSRAEADEFAAALDDYLASRANRSDGTWSDGQLAFRAVRVSSETVVLLAGNGTFVADAAVSGTNASVSVSVDPTPESTRRTVTTL